MKLEFSENDMKSLIDFTRKSKSKNADYILKKWEKSKALKLTDEELTALENYKIFEHKIQDDVLLLYIQNMSGIENKIIELILKKYDTYNYYQFFDDSYNCYWERLVIINLNKLKFELYDNDKYMQYYEDDNFLMFLGAMYPWRAESEEENNYYDKHSLEELRNLTHDGYYEINHNLYNFRLLLKDDANILTIPAIGVIKKIIKERL